MSIAYSFPKKQGRSFSDERNNSPGPNAYDPQRAIRIVKEQSPEWTIPGTDRPDYRKGGPGPGNYEADINKFKMNVSYTMGSKVDYQSPSKSVSFQMPGPGAYEHHILNKPPVYSMGVKREEIKNLNTPGPGTYDNTNANESMRNSQRVVASPFGSKSKRDSQIIHKQAMSEIMTSPGPGAYTPNAEYIKYQNPTYGMSKGNKGITSKDFSPGPGYYEAASKEIGKSMNNLTFKGRPQTSKAIDVPGPGSYNYQHKTIDQTIKSQRGVSTMRNKGEKLISPSKDQIKNPGPGAYDGNYSAVKDKGRAFGFGNSQRKSAINKDEMFKPGPGNYEVKDMKSQRAVKIGQKNNYQNKNTTPGPGNYEPNSDFVKSSSKSVKIHNGLNRSSLKSSQSQYINPGPGSYSQAKEFGKDAKSYQIRGKPKDIQRDMSPGPGAYDPIDALSKDKKYSATILSGSKRNQDYYTLNSSNPGPGQYNDLNKEFGKNAKSFTIQNKTQQKVDNKVPGPGYYDANDDLIRSHTPGYKQSNSTRKEFISKEDKIKPGPGQYSNNHKSIGKDVPSFTLGAKREMKQGVSPGPGQYDANQNFTKDSIRNVKMNNSQRPDIIAQTARDQPGPGSYNNVQNFGQDQPTFSFSSRKSQIQGTKTPGPGAYNVSPAPVKDKVPSYKMGYSKRSKLISNEAINTPGPGIYEKAPTIGQGGPKYSFQPRNEPKINTLVPGPGEYDPNNDVLKDKVRSYQMGTSQRGQQMIQKEAQYIPGPGNYESPTKTSGPQYTMRGRSRSRQDLSPGPGEYELQNNLIKYKSPAYCMNKSMRQDIIPKDISQIPGPGSYQNPNEFGKDVKSVNFYDQTFQFQIRGKPEDIVKNDVPGPGSYQANGSVIKDRIIAHKMTASTRPEIVTKEMLYQPGPGEYDSPKAFGHDAKSVTIRGKPKDNQRNDSPGPGHYSPDPSIVKDKAVSYRMGNTKRTEIISKEQQQLPGPGIYDQPSLIGKNQTYTIGQKHKDQKDNMVPGPGQYDPSDSLMIDQAQNSFKIALSSRQPFVGREMIDKPGPGHYESPSKQTGPNYTMGGRLSSPVNDLPGPGQYDPNESITKYQIPSAKIDQKSQRTNIISKEELQKPGPGNYNYNSNFGDDAKSFQIRGKPQEKVGNEVPGPGEYEPTQSISKDRSIAFKIASSLRGDIVNREMIDKPGPGQYESPSKQIGPSVNTFKQLSFQYTMGGRAESPVINTPGPGQYDPDASAVRHQNPSIRFDDKTQRTNIISKEELLKPGPGNYEVIKNFGEDAKTFQIRGKPQEKVGNEVPGPGEYEPAQSQNKDRAVSYKIGSTQRQNIVNKEASNLPGPGHYDSPSRQSGPQFTIGQRTESPVTYTPGPGEYNPDPSVIRHQNPSIRFNDNTQRTNIISKEELQKPGPGNYQYSQNFGDDAKSFQIRGRPQERVGNEVPGPGEYQPDSNAVRHHSPTFKIDPNTQRTNLISKEEIYKPGPGNYSHTTNFGDNAQTFTIREKPKDKIGNDIPGPGEYSPDTNVNRYQSPSIKIDSKSQRTNLISKEEFQKPGPGNYSHSVNFGDDAQTFTIRGKPQEKVGNEVPGPGEYQPDSNIMRHQNPSVRIDSKTQRTNIVSKHEFQKPGPGQYDQSLNFGDDAQSFQIRGRPIEKIGNNIPGPGEYSPDSNVIRYQSPSAKIDSRTQRTTLISKEDQQKQGPGSYSLSYNFGDDAQSFLIRGRPQDKVGNEVPGPGNYDPNDSIVKYQSPSYKMNDKTQRTTLILQEQVYLPGPGNYDQHSTIGAGQSFQIRGKPSPERDNQVPGPGTYQANHNVIKDGTGQSFRISQNKREFNLVQQDIGQQPGPGFYDIQQQYSGPVYTIRGKDQVNDDNGVPGPGTYQGNQNIMKHNNPSIDFSRSPDRSRTNSPSKDNIPGPGQYEDDINYYVGNSSVITYTIPKAEYKQQVSEAPGPGYYKLPAKVADVPRYNKTAQNEDFRWV